MKEIISTYIVKYFLSADVLFEIDSSHLFFGGKERRTMEEKRLYHHIAEKKKCLC
jgi:hypothetical protein